MSEQRDELAEVIGIFGYGGIKLSAYPSSGRVSVEVSADNAVMDFSELIGFVDQIRKPRTITEHYGEKGIEDLPFGTVILSGDTASIADTEGTWLTNDGSTYDFWELALPATVLYEPTP